MSNTNTAIKTNDTTAPAPKLVMTLFPFPTLPKIRMLNDGDDLEVVIREELGGEIEETAPDSMLDRELGVLRMVRRGETQLHVHSHPEAEANIRLMIEDMARMVQLSDALRELGIDMPQGPHGVGCTCPHDGEELQGLGDGTLH